MTPNPRSRLLAFGRICFGLGVAGIGVQHLVIANLVNVVSPVRIASPLPAYLVGSGLLLAGAALVCNRRVRPVGLLVGAFFAAMFFFAHLPDLVAQARRAPAGTPVWMLVFSGTTALKATVFAGGAWLIASLGPGGGLRSRRLLRGCGAYALGFFMLYCGIEHFLYLKFVADLIPVWIPAHVFWTEVAGVALIAGGLGLLSGVCAPLAAGLSGLMIFLWVFLLHLPRALADSYSLHGNEWTSVCEALAFSGLGFVLWQVLPQETQP